MIINHTLMNVKDILFAAMLTNSYVVIIIDLVNQYKLIEVKKFTEKNA